MNGTWEGLMHDVEGLSANATMDLVLEGEILKGRFGFRMAGAHAPRKLVEGQAEGRVSKGGLVELTTKLEGIGVVRFEGRQMAVKHHARSALVGTYRVEGPRTEPVGGGSAIFWLFEQPKQ